MLQMIGLLGERTRPTLTGYLNAAREYAEQKYQYPAISLWYPNIGDVSDDEAYFGVESRLDDSQRSYALQVISTLNLSPRAIDKFEERLQRADKFLPSSKLGSIIEVPRDAIPIINFHQVMERDGLTIFSNDPQQLVQLVREFVNGSIYYMRQDLSMDRIANDIVKISIETQLRLAGEALMNPHFPKVTQRRALAVWEKEKERIRRDWSNNWAPRF